MSNMVPLPPNATKLEQAYIASGGKALDLDLPIDQVWDAWNCPAMLLPWLAWALSVDVWNDAWPEDRKRRAIAESPEQHRIKGTVLSVQRALSLLGCRTVIKEWWQTVPEGRRGTFKVTAFVAERDSPTSPLISPALLSSARAAVMATKPKSRAFQLQLAAGVSSSVGVAGGIAGVVAAQAAMPVRVATDFAVAAGVAGGIAGVVAARAVQTVRAITDFKSPFGVAGGIASVTAVTANMRAA